MNGFEFIRGLSSFNGTELIQICIGQNEIIMRFFPEKKTITLFNIDTFINDNNKFIKNFSIGQKLIPIIGEKLDIIDFISDKKVVLKFSDGTDIILRDDSEQYESVTFECDGNFFAA